jgi:molecular chaperone HscA
MALLQIAEPGLAAAPHQHRLAVGIDLGTTNSLVATVASGMARPWPTKPGHRCCPRWSTTAKRRRRCVGREASRRPGRRPPQHHRLGQAPDGPRPRRRRRGHAQPYLLSDGPGMVGIDTRAGRKTPVEVSADILRACASAPKPASVGELTGAVITVPAYFDDAQRQATKDAAAPGRPQRAAPAQRTDCRGHRLRPGQRRRRHLRRLRPRRRHLRHLDPQADPRRVRSARHQRRPGARRRRLRPPPGRLAEGPGHLPDDCRCEDRRRLLALRAQRQGSAVRIEARATVATCSFSGTLSIGAGQPRRLRELTADLVERTLRPVRKALRDAGLGADDVKGVVMVGGSTRMPQVRAAVESSSAAPR